MQQTRFVEKMHKDVMLDDIVNFFHMGPLAEMCCVRRTCDCWSFLLLFTLIATEKNPYLTRPHIFLLTVSCKDRWWGTKTCSYYDVDRNWLGHPLLSMFQATNHFASCCCIHGCSPLQPIMLTDLFVAGGRLAGCTCHNDLPLWASTSKLISCLIFCWLIFITIWFISLKFWLV